MEYLLALYLGAFLSVEVADYRFNMPLICQTTRTAKCYDWFEQYLPKDSRTKTQIDYSEGLFETFTENLEAATLQKYEYIYQQLGLKPGMKLLDVGCGSGVWMAFCKKRDVEVVGLTLSKEQAQVVAAKGLNVHVRDYREAHEEFFGMFDRITALGSSEHLSTASGSLNGTLARDRSVRKFTETWRLFNRYLKNDGRVYLTLLTINPEAKWSLMDWFQTYILERTYGGYYPQIKDLVEKVVPQTGFEISDLHDRTRDYHWSSVVDPEHFGNWKINWSENTIHKLTYFLKGIFTDPYLVHKWAYYFLNTWMWQFGGYQTKPMSNEQVAKSPMQLKYFMLTKTKCAELLEK